MISNEGYMVSNSLVTLLALYLYYNLELSHKHSKYLYHWFFVVQPIRNLDHLSTIQQHCFVKIFQKSI